MRRQQSLHHNIQIRPSTFMRDIQGLDLPQKEPHDLCGGLDAPIPVRVLLVRAKIYRSEMTINQKNITFGKMVVGSYATKNVMIENCSPFHFFTQSARVLQSILDM